MGNNTSSNGRKNSKSTRTAPLQPDQGSNDHSDTSAEDQLMEPNFDLETAVDALVHENEIMRPNMEHEEIIAEVDRLDQNPIVKGIEEDGKDENGKRGPEGLPEEIWEKILQNLEDSKDILNFFKVIPELEGRILKNKCQWLFDQIIPHIFLLLNKSDLLNCRLVCKNWNFGVTNFVENHPSRRAYNPESQLTGQHWNPHASKLYDDVKKHFQSMWPYMLYENVRKHVALDMNPPGRNPFFGRAMRIIDTFGIYQGAYVSKGSYKNDVHTSRFLKRFGSHIWYLTIGIKAKYYHRDPPHFFQLLKQILVHLPNLKSLRMDGNMILSPSLKRRLSDLVASNFLHQLESVEVHLDPMIDFFIPTYSQQIRRLKIEVWRVDHCCHFPKLTEFELCRTLPLPVITKTIANLIAPKLSTLSFSMTICNLSAIRNEIIPLLARFDNLHSLAIRLEGLPDRRESSQATFEILPVPPLKVTSFSLDGKRVHEMDFDFLRLLPSLEYLRIGSNKTPEFLQEQNLYEPNLWQVILPKLKEIVLKGMLDHSNHQYTRAHYEAHETGRIL